MQGRLPEGAKIILMAPPLDTTGAAYDTLYVKLGQYRRLAIIIVVGNRAGATTPNVTLTQATSSGGAGAKSLAFDQAWGVDGVAQTSGKDTLTALTVTSDAVPLSANDNSVLVIDIRADQLDINNGFKWVKATIATPGANACPVAVVGIAYAGDHVAKPETLPTLLA